MYILSIDLIGSEWKKREMLIKKNSFSSSQNLTSSIFKDFKALLWAPEGSSVH